MFWARLANIQPSPPSGLVGNAVLATSFQSCQCTQIPRKMLKFYNPPCRPGLAATPGQARVLTVGVFPAPVLISDNLPRHPCLLPAPRRSSHAQVLTVGVFPAPVLTSDNLPRRPGLPPSPGQAFWLDPWRPGAGRPAAGLRAPGGNRPGAGGKRDPHV